MYWFLSNLLSHGICRYPSTCCESRLRNPRQSGWWHDRQEKRTTVSHTLLMQSMCGGVAFVLFTYIFLLSIISCLHAVYRLYHTSHKIKVCAMWTTPSARAHCTASRGDVDFVVRVAFLCCYAIRVLRTREHVVSNSHSSYIKASVYSPNRQNYDIMAYWTMPVVHGDLRPPASVQQSTPASNAEQSCEREQSDWCLE